MGIIVPVTKKVFAARKHRATKNNFATSKNSVTNKFVTKKNLLASLAALLLLSIASPASFSSTVNSQVCFLSSGTWANTPLPQAQSGSFRITFDATPSATNVDAVEGLSSGSASAYANMFVAVRFNTSGHIDARNGSAYVAASVIPCATRVTYHFILDVNVATHSYNAYVMIGWLQATIRTGLAFRNELASPSSLGYVAADHSRQQHLLQHCFEQLFDGSVHHHAACEPIDHSWAYGHFFAPRLRARRHCC
jgi:hypothetical protein